jgi:hypothetical protein
VPRSSRSAASTGGSSRTRRTSTSCSFSSALSGRWRSHRRARLSDLGSGSQEKNYITGFGRGYVLRKWSVLESPRRLARVLLEDGMICAAQALFHRTLAGVRESGSEAGGPGTGMSLMHAAPRLCT